MGMAFCHSYCHPKHNFWVVFKNLWPFSSNYEWQKVTIECYEWHYEWYCEWQKRATILWMTNSSAHKPDGLLVSSIFKCLGVSNLSDNARGMAKVINTCRKRQDYVYVKISCFSLFLNEHKFSESKQSIIIREIRIQIHIQTNPETVQVHSQWAKAEAKVKIFSDICLFFFFFYPFNLFFILFRFSFH